MTPKQEAALRLAREALQYVYEGANNQGPHTGISWRCASNKIEPVIAAIDEVLSDNALDKMAENARELGLDYEPAQKDYKAFYDGKKWYSVEVEPPCKTGSQCTSKCQQCEQPAKEQKLEFVSPGGGYVPAIPRPIPLDWKLVPRKATPEMLKAMDECAQEGYDERLYEGMASSVYMAAWDASPVMGSLPTSNTFKEWFYSKPHRAKYSSDHPAYLAAQEAWEAAHEACAKVCEEDGLLWGQRYAAAIRAKGNT